ncbi:MAG TPA: TolC family protein [Gemmatimonadaceae bacterium]
MPPTRPRALRLALALFIPAAVAAPPLRAQQPLTLGDAVTMAESQGLAAHAAERAREAARQRDRAFGARLLPRLVMAGTLPSFSRSISPVVQPDGTTLFTPLRRTDAKLSLGVEQPIPLTGGSLSITSSLDRLQITGAEEVRTWTSTPIAITLRQDLFRPNALRWDAREQDATLDVAERQYLEAREDVAIRTTEAFFDLYAARTALDNASKNVAINDTLYRLNTGRYQVGKIGENDLLQSELALLRARTSLDGARLEYDRTLAALRLALGLPVGAPLEIVAPSAVPDVAVDTAVAVAEALRNQSQPASLELQRIQARRHVSEAKLNDGFGASVEASVGFDSPAAPVVGDAYQNLLQSQRFSLGVELPILQWGARSADTQAAEAELDRVTTTARLAREEVAQQAHFAALQLAQARRTLLLSAKADTVATKRFDVAYNRYVIGKIGIDNLYIAQSEKDQALQQYVQALRGYWTSYYRLRRVTLYDFEAGRRIRRP